MCHALLSDSKFLALLVRIDHEFAAQCRVDGCRCGGRLHSADYPRKPRGCPPGMREDFSSRLSFSCARCRTRSTSLSVRFLGRRVYLALAVVLVSDSGRGSTSASAGAAAKLGAELGVPRQSLKRWRNWWSEQFPLTPLWRATCARFMPAVDVAELPAALLGRFAGSLTESVMRMLVFLSPVTLRDGGPGGPGGPGVIEVFEGR